MYVLVLACMEMLCVHGEVVNFIHYYGTHTSFSVRVLSMSCSYDCSVALHLFSTCVPYPQHDRARQRQVGQGRTGQGQWSGPGGQHEADDVTPHSKWRSRLGLGNGRIGLGGGQQGTGK